MCPVYIDVTGHMSNAFWLQMEFVFYIENTRLHAATLMFDGCWLRVKCLPRFYHTLYWCQSINKLLLTIGSTFSEVAIDSNIKCSFYLC